MSDGTPQPGDDAQLRAWRRRYAEETERGFSLRLPLALARRLRAEALARGVPHSRYVADLLRAATGDLPGGPPPAPASPPAAAGGDAGAGRSPRSPHRPAPRGPRWRAAPTRHRRQSHRPAHSTRRSRPA